MNNRLARLLANPQLNGWGFLIGIVGLLFALYTYFDTQSYPKLMAQVHPSRTILVSSEGAQDLVISAKGKLIKGPVTSAQISIWNAGTKPIKAEDILEKIEIKTSNNSPLLSVRILKTTRAVCKVTTNTSQASLGILGLGLQILEKGDGVLIQLTYLGDEKVDFIGSGVIVGQNSFQVTKLISSENKAQKKEKYKTIWDTIVTLSLILLFIMILIALLSNFVGTTYANGIGKNWSNAKNKKDKAKVIFFVAFVILASIVLLIFLIAAIASLTQSYSPFLT